MPKSTQLIVPQTYAELERAVLAVVHKGRREIDRAWLMTFHETGRLIHVHLLLKQPRAAYGAQVYADLAAATGSSSRSLHEFTQFYRYFPIVRGPAQFNWNHYRVLCQVAEPARRNALVAEAEKGGWNSMELERRVRSLALSKPDVSDTAKNVTPEKLLKPLRGTPGLHPIADRGRGLVVDLGFKVYRPLTAEQARRLAKGDMCDSRRTAASRAQTTRPRPTSTPTAPRCSA